MLNRILLLVFFSFFSCSYAQKSNEIFGYVVIQNSKTNTGNLEYVPNVSISSNNGYFKPQLTDSNGYFKLIFSNDYDRTKVKLQIEKEGYEVVNLKELEASSIIGNKESIKIVLCKQSELERNRLIYYGLAKEFISIARHRKIYKEGIYRKQLVLDSLNSSLYLNENLLQKVFNIDITAQKLAKEWANQNLDDKSSEYKKAFGLIKKGLFQEAIRILDEIDFKNRLKINQQFIDSENRRIKSSVDKIILSKKRQRSDIKQLVERGELKMLNHDLYGAIADLELALTYDDTNLELILSLAFAYQENNNKNCLNLYHKVYKLTNDMFTKTVVSHNVGVFHLSRGALTLAYPYLLKAEKEREKLYLNGRAKSNYLETLVALARLYYLDPDISAIEAQTPLLKLIAIIDSEKNPSKHRIELLTQAEIEFANLCLMRGDLINAEKSYNKVDSMLKNNMNSIVRAVASFRIASYELRIIKDTVKARYRLEKSIIEYEESVDGIYNLYDNPIKTETEIGYINETLSNMYVLLANCYRETKQKNLVNLCYSRAALLSLYINDKNKKTLRLLLNFIPIMLEVNSHYLSEGDKENSEYNLKQMFLVLNKLKKDNFLLDLNYLYINVKLADYFTAANEFEKAMKLLDNNIKIIEKYFNKNPDKFGFDYILSAIDYGTTYLKLNNKTEYQKSTSLLTLKKSKKHLKYCEFENKYISDLKQNVDILIKEIK
ncbi:tetratricopeptide repeat protein [Costertonia aggregata]|uniref:Carboxypeptidase regulatory-like domain-containing protein n=1 Tax=Costertonia aggregata TaxID=343403 RepID=A0A7H9APL1_9FLAO|nr:hypothetical protein [Costertonia aggregata]QLG45411.1 hypothetical protein HYG79_08645 [Costertonia aggregata]